MVWATKNWKLWDHPLTWEKFDVISWILFLNDQPFIAFDKGSHLLLSAPIKTGKGLGMEESYDEGLANHIGPRVMCW